MGHVIFLSQALSLGIEDKFLASIHAAAQPRLPQILTVRDSDNAGGQPCMANIQDVWTWASVQAIPALSLRKPVRYLLKRG